MFWFGALFGVLASVSGGRDLDMVSVEALRRWSYGREVAEEGCGLQSPVLLS